MTEAIRTSASTGYVHLTVWLVDTFLCTNVPLVILSAVQGRLPVTKTFLVFRKTYLSLGGSVDLLEFYISSGRLPCLPTEEISIWATKSNKVNVLSWLREKGWNDKRPKDALDSASSSGSFDALVWLESICDKGELRSLRYECIRTALISGHLEIVKWLWKNLIKDPKHTLYQIDMMLLACFSDNPKVWSFLFFSMEAVLVISVFCVGEEFVVEAHFRRQCFFFQTLQSLPFSY